VTPPQDLTIERLQAHASFARALARGLLRDENAADDVVQDAYVAALERPPERNPRAWFAVVARRLSLNALRGSRRRDAREAAAARPEPPETPADVAARRDAVRAVLDAVLALDEPFQTVVILRFYEDLPPSEIAVRLGVPAATVRTRLHRALALLRELLDDERDDWRAALLPVAGWPRSTPGPAAAAAAGAAGGVLVATKLLVAGSAALLFAFAAWAVLGRGSPGEAGTDERDAPETAARRDLPRRDSAPRAREGDEGEDAAAAAPAASETTAEETGPARIAGRVIDERTGGPAAGAEILVLAGDGSREALAAAKPRARADAEGRFVCANLAAGAHHVTARAPGLLDAHAHGVEAVEGEGKEVKLALGVPQAIAGRVLAPADVPVTGAKAYCTIPNDRTAKWAWWSNLSAETPVAADGSFVLPGLPRREFDVWAEVKLGARRWSAGAAAIETGGPPVVLTFEDATEPTRRFRLRVLDPSGRPVAIGKARRYMYQWSGAWQGPADQEIRDGIVEIDLPDIVRTLWYEPYSWRDDGGREIAAAPALVAFEIAKDGEKSVRLEPAVALDGRVRDPSGRGVAGASVVARPDVAPLADSLRLDPHGRAVTDESGAFRIEGLAPMGYRLAVGVPPEFVPVDGVAAKPGEPAEILLVASLRPVLVVLDADGVPVAGSSAELTEPGDGPEVSRGEAGPDGRLRLDRVPPQRRFDLTIDGGEKSARLVVRDWTPSDATFRLPPAMVLRGTVVDRAGAPVPTARVWIRRDGARDDYDDTNDRGVFFFERLAPGDVRLLASAGHDDPPADASATIVRAGERNVLLVVDPGLVLRATIDNWGDRDPSLIWSSPAFIEDGPAPARVHWGHQSAERLSFAGLPPGCTGTILFGPMTGDFVVFQRGVRTDAGQVQVSFVRGKRLSGRVLYPPGVSPHAADVHVVADVLGVEIGDRQRRAGQWNVDGVPDGTWPVRATLTLGDRTWEATGTASPGTETELELR
jgi:RNA polymerase sigma-70 factor (ECF subfamily)